MYSELRRVGRPCDSYRLRGSAGVNLAGETNSRHTQYTQYAQCIELEGVRMRTVELFSNMNIHESSAARASRR